MKAKNSTLLLISALVLLTESLVPAWATTYVVNQNGSGPYYTINSAIAVAQNGDTVLVMPGVYSESVTLNHQIVLQGYDPYSTFIYSGTDAIRCRTGAGQSVIKGFDIRANDQGIVVYNEGVSPIVEHNIIHNCSSGIYSDERILTIRDNIIKYCGYGIYLYYDLADAIIYNNVIHNCTNVAICSSGPNNVADPIVYSNIVFQNTIGLSGTGTCTGSFTYNDVWNNTTNWAGINYGPGNIASDPQFINLNSGDYHLLATSPCIDMGIPGTEYLDPNGTRNDMGIFGGPNCWGGGGPGVTSMTVTPVSVPQGQPINVQASGTVQ